MARCIICGAKLKFMHTKWDEKRQRDIWCMLHAYGIDLPSNALENLCFGDCTLPLGKLEFYYQGRRPRPSDLKECAEARDYLLQKITQNQYNKIIDVAAFSRFLNGVYQKIEESCDVEALLAPWRTQITNLFKNRVDALGDKYPNLICAQDPTLNHLCGTKQGQSLVLIENRHPKLDETRLYSRSLDTVQNLYKQIQEMDDSDMFAITTIPLNDIICFQLVGNIDRVVTTSGGGGGGGAPNLGGALVGGLLFGSVGAIIGSQTGISIDPIKSTINEYDSRKTLLNLRNADGVAEIRELPFFYAEIFTKVIPEKEFSFLEAERNSSAAPVKEKPQNDNAIEAIKKFKELLDMGIITQEEFDAKKKQLLDL